ncbi:hypothetical protein TNCV_3060771 [Trichonephila clavipes]|uniref:Uncharacterized protein n=1 Tax=Trichonephila clavipes TaxID=2585209 RepID=A0A8X6W0K8_TRICX|nr:hypothetical protein TNCV_3060771 [Trichonephila clavipes]
MIRVKEVLKEELSNTRAIAENIKSPQTEAVPEDRILKQRSLVIGQRRASWSILQTPTCPHLNTTRFEGYLCGHSEVSTRRSTPLPENGK